MPPVLGPGVEVQPPSDTAPNGSSVRRASRVRLGLQILQTQAASAAGQLGSAWRGAHVFGHGSWLRFRWMKVSVKMTRRNGFSVDWELDPVGIGHGRLANASWTEPEVGRRLMLL